MKKNILHLFTVISLLVFGSCSKDNPVPVTDQEELGSAELIFTEVKVEPHDDHFHYNDFEGAEKQSIKFTGKDLLPPVKAHMHLHVGKTYRFELKATDFAGRPAEQTFIDSEEQHFAFWLNAPASSMKVIFADKKADKTRVKVGTVGYISVLKETNAFELRYIMRHLNPGVKSKIDLVNDIQNKDFTKFGGANDLDLKFEMHFVGEEHSH